MYFCFRHPLHNGNLLGFIDLSGESSGKRSHHSCRPIQYVIPDAMLYLDRLVLFIDQANAQHIVVN